MKNIRRHIFFFFTLMCPLRHLTGSFFKKTLFNGLSHYIKCKNFTPYVTSGSVFFTLLAWNNYNNNKKPSHNISENGENVSPSFKEVLSKTIEGLYKK